MGSEYPTRRCAALLEFVGQLTLRRAASSPLPLKKKRLKFNGADGSPRGTMSLRAGLGQVALPTSSSTVT